MAFSRRSHTLRLVRFGIAALLLCACTKPSAPAPQPWPTFPTTDAARDALVKERTLRATGTPTDFSPEAIIAAAEALGFDKLPSGETRVYAWIAQQQAAAVPQAAPGLKRP